MGKTYLPRKFKTAVVIPPLNDVDCYGNDLDFVAVSDGNGQLAGFNVLAGGGLSMEHGNTKTYPNISLELGFVPPEHALKAAEAVVTTQRDRQPQRPQNARTRYTIQNMGLDNFRAEVERRMGMPFEPIRPFKFTGRGDRIGWVKGIDGNWHLTLFIESGRLVDEGGKQLLTGVLEIAKIHKGDFRITANQNLIVANVAEADKAKIEELARTYGLIRNDVSKLRENAMSCVSFPTCPLAMAEAERVLPDFIGELDKIMAKHGTSDDYIVTRITGCPNGCGRAMLAEIGLVGKAVGRYNLHIGGDREAYASPTLQRKHYPAGNPFRIRRPDRQMGGGTRYRRRFRRFRHTDGHRQTRVGCARRFLGRIQSRPDCARLKPSPHSCGDVLLPHAFPFRKIPILGIKYLFFISKHKTKCRLKAFSVQTA